MQHDLIPFAFEDHLVRVFEVDGAPWFVAKDVAAALGIVWKAAETLARIPEKWKGVRNLRTPSGDQSLLIISEAGVYKLAFRSNKPEAEAFTDWVAEEVLPAIHAALDFGLSQQSFEAAYVKGASAALKSMMSDLPSRLAFALSAFDNDGVSE